MYQVLVVDDNPLAAEGICQNLTNAELDIEIAAVFHDGQSALDYLKQVGEIHLIVSDIRMPGMDGLELSRCALDEYPSIKIILISAYDDFEYAKQALRIGAFDYVEKPIDYSYLFEVVNKAFQQTEMEKRHMEQLKRSLPVLKDHFFRELLSVGGEEARFRLDSYISFLGINLDLRYFNCSILSIENAEQAKQTAGVEKYHANLLSLLEYVREAFCDFPLVHLSTELDKIYVITAITCRNENIVIERLNDAWSAIIEAKNPPTLTLSIGIGSVVNGVWNLFQSCKTAKSALEYRFFFPQKSIFDYRDVGIAQPTQLTVGPQIEEELINSVCKRDLEEIELISQRFAKHFVDQYTKKGSIFLSVYSLMGRLQKLMEDMGISSRRLQEEIIAALSNQETMMSPNNISSLVLNICKSACSEIEQSANNHYMQICHMVNSFIKQNYSDTSLGLKMLAAHVNVSPAHLSAVYKKTLNKNISDTITGARIKVAKLLLETTELNIREISEQTGYSNQYYFSANFKKYTGMSPTEFRNI